MENMYFFVLDIMQLAGGEEKNQENYLANFNRVQTQS